jgi:hypothetical protein
LGSLPQSSSPSDGEGRLETYRPMGAHQIQERPRLVDICVLNASARRTGETLQSQGLITNPHPAEEYFQSDPFEPATDSRASSLTAGTAAPFLTTRKGSGSKKPPSSQQASQQSSRFVEHKIGNNLGTPEQATRRYAHGGPELQMPSRTFGPGDYYKSSTEG